MKQPLRVEDFQHRLNSTPCVSRNTDERSGSDAGNIIALSLMAAAPTWAGRFQLPT